MDDRVCPAAEEEAGEEDGLSHHGDADEEEVIVLEDPHEVEEVGPRAVPVPRAPTQKEIEAHMATHLPHPAWCEICMRGRGRNSPHKRKKMGVGEPDPESTPQRSSDAPAPAVEAAEEEVPCSDSEAGLTTTG